MDFMKRSPINWDAILKQDSAFRPGRRVLYAPPDTDSVFRGYVIYGPDIDGRGKCLYQVSLNSAGTIWVYGSDLRNEEEEEMKKRANRWNEVWDGKPLTFREFYAKKFLNVGFIEGGGYWAGMKGESWDVVQKRVMDATADYQDYLADLFWKVQ